MNPQDKDQLVPLTYKLLEKERDAMCLENFCELRERFGDTSWIKLDWIVEEAQLGHRVVEVEVLNIPCFYFVQCYPWFMRNLDRGVRLFVGHIPIYRTDYELWVGWEQSDVPNAPPKLIFHGHADKDHDDIKIAITPDVRKHIKWWFSLEQIFKFSCMGNNITDTVIRQDAHLRAIAKVLARFPGLVVERDPTSEETVIAVNGPGWSKFPFTDREQQKPENPYRDFTRLLNLGNVDTKEYEDGTNKGKWTGSEDNMLGDESEDEDEDKDEEGVTYADPDQYDNWQDEYEDWVGVLSGAEDEGTSEGSSSGDTDAPEGE